MGGKTYTVEYAKSGRAQCKGCKEKIDKDVARIGEHADNDGQVFTKWFHVRCFKIPKKNPPSDTDFGGYEDLTSDDFKILQRHLGGGGEEGEDGEKPAKKSKTGPAPDEEDGELYEKYRKMNVGQLKQVLKANHQLLGGTKDELAARCVDGEKWGALPTCPMCGKGRLKVAYQGHGHGGQGTFSCPGFFDEDSKIGLLGWLMQVDLGMINRCPMLPAYAHDQFGNRVSEARMQMRMPCKFKAELMERLPWRMEADPNEPAGTPMKGGKEAADGMDLAARFKGGALLGTKDRETNEWMPAAALARLAEEYPKQNKSQAPSSKCPKNDPLVEVFDELAVLERKAGTEGFK
eukprot:gene21667-26060_t